MGKISAVIILKDKRVTVSESNVDVVGTTFPSDIYQCNLTGNGMAITIKTIDEQHEMYSTPEIDEIKQVVANFMGEEVYDKVKEIGYKHKMGILLHGEAGTGKTSILNYVALNLIDSSNAIVLIGNSQDSLMGAMTLAAGIREIQDNPIIIIADEFERWATKSESEMKAFLDGNDAIDNLLFLAATNYLEQIPLPIRERLSRFKLVKKITGISDPDKVMEIVRTKLSKEDLSDEELLKIINTKKSWKTDEIKHIALDVIQNNLILKIDNNSTTVGFQSSSTKEEKKKLVLNDRVKKVFTYQVKTKESATDNVPKIKKKK